MHWFKRNRSETKNLTNLFEEQKTYIKTLEDDNLAATELLSDNLETLQAEVNSSLKEILFILKKRQIESDKINAFDKKFIDILNVFSPNVNFIGNSVENLSKTEQLTNVLEILKTIEKRGIPNNVIKVKTLKNWYECHFNTGKSDDGRIYFRINKKLIDVIISNKKNQLKGKDLALMKRRTSQQT